MKPKIIDAFIFFDELDVLEVRLHELDPVVDQFVIVEADKTFKGNPKPLYFQQNAHKFAPFKEKITHYVVNFPGSLLKTGLNELELKEQNWQRQEYQRNSINQALQKLNLQEKDIILVSDCDEIPKAKKIATLYKWFIFRKFAIFVQRACYYYFNNITDPFDKWCGTVACRYKNFKKIGAQDLRRANLRAGRRLERYGIREKLKNYPYLIHDAGWHFSFFGGEVSVQRKLDSISANYSMSSIESKTAHHRYSVISEGNWDIPEFLPDYVKQNKEKFKQHFIFSKNN